MVESNMGGTAEQKPSPETSKDAYEVYREQKFNKLKKEPNPLLIDVEAAELLLLVVRNPDFTLAERLKEYAVVAQLTMARMYGFVKDPTTELSIAQGAEMIHGAYATVFANAMIELAKLAEERPPVDYP
jgi:hypothetical protein